MVDKLLLSALVCTATAAPPDTELVNNQIEGCLKQGLLLSPLDGGCYSPLVQGPCDEGSWFVQVKDQGEGTCVKQQCSLPEVYFKGACVSVENDNVCEEKGKFPRLNFQGETSCVCDREWIKGTDGKCHLLFSQGNCGEGLFISSRDRAVQEGLDVSCGSGFSCVQESQCPHLSFYEGLEENYDSHGSRCRMKGEGGFCCPDTPLDNKENESKFYLDRLSQINTNVGVCLQNPCTVFSILLKQTWLPYEDEEGTFNCFKASEPGTAQCSGSYSVMQISAGELELVCCKNQTDCITPFGPVKAETDCTRRNFYWSHHRKRCVPCFSG